MSKNNYVKSLDIFQRAMIGLGDRFQRQATWSPTRVMAILLLLKTPGTKMSYRSALAVAKQRMRSLLSWPETPTIGSMSKARPKLSGTTCRLFMQTITDLVTHQLHKPRHVWKKRRIIGVDGSTFIVPRSADTLKNFRCPSGGKDVPAAHHPRALSVLAFDVLRRVPIDFVVGRKGQGEPTLLRPLLDRFKPGDVIVLDRGYPSRALFFALVERKIDVVVRITADNSCAWKEFRNFISGTKKSQDMVIKCGKTGKDVSVKVRLVERNLRPGKAKKGVKKERMIILTTLSESDGFTRNELIKLYAARWGVETAFRELKSFMNTEPFHTKTANGVEQEIAAGLIWMSLASLLESTALDGVPDTHRVVRADCYRFAALLLEDFLMDRYDKTEFFRLVDELKRYAQKRPANRHEKRKCTVSFGRSHKQFS